jgi:hypothetical protein
MKKPQLVLLLILGLLVGLVIHGLFEILAIWVLINRLSCFFFWVSWDTWLLVHLVFSVVVEIIGVVLVFWIYKKKTSWLWIAKKKKT